MGERKANGATAATPPVRLAWAEDVPEASEGWVTQRALAVHLDLSPRRIRAMVAAGILPAGDRSREKGGTLDLARCRVSYVRYLRDVAAGRTVPGDAEPSGERLDLARERAALARAQREAQEIRNAESRDALVSVAEVAGLWSKVLLSLRNRLRAIPGELRRRHPTLAPAEVASVGEAIDDALTELSEGEAISTSGGNDAEDESQSSSA